MKFTSSLPCQDRLLYKGLIVIAVPLLFGFAFTILLTQLLAESERKIQHELLLKEAMSTVARINGYAFLTRCCADSYFAFRDPYYKTTYKKSFHTVKTEFVHLKQLLRGESGLQQHLLNMRQKIGSIESQCRPIMNLNVFLPGIKNLINQFGKDSSAVRLMVDQSRYESGSLEETLRRQAAAEASATVQSMVNIQIALACGVADSLLLTLFLAIYFSKRITVRLISVLDNTIKLDKGKTLNAPLKGSDEIAELDKFLYKSALEIRELERFKREMAGVVSHELKSPLTSVNTFLISLSSGVFGELSVAARDKAERAQKNVARLMDLIKDLINLDKFETGKLEISPGQVAVLDLLSTSVDSLKELSEKLAVKIEIKNAAGSVYADRDRLVQVVVNLLSNALKFSPAHGTVTIETGNKDGWFEARVSDQGRGISASSQEKIFEPFHQVETGDATLKKGTGLGLTICRNIVEQHGGKIGVDSAEGQGSTFWFRLPESQAPESDKSRDSKLSQTGSTRAHLESSSRNPSLLPDKNRPGGLKILHKGLILISIPLLFELLFVILLTLLVNQNQEQIRLEERSKDVVLAGNQLLRELAERENDGLLFSYTQNPDLLNQWKQARKSIDSSYERLKQLTTHDITQKENIELIKTLLLDEDRLSIRLLNTGGADLAEYWHSPGLSEQAKAVLMRSQTVAENLVNVEKQNGERIFLQRARATKFIETALIAGNILNILISIMLAIYLISSITNRLRHVMANMEHLVKNEPLAPPAAGGDEIAYLDQQFYATANHLSELENFKRELISIVSHELRTPLMSISASLNLLFSGALGALSEKAKQRLKIAEKETERLVRLITDLLDIEKMQAGKFVMAPADVTVAELIKSAIASIAEQAESRNIEIETAIADSTIHADRDRITQVIVNLLSNAIKFSQAGSSVKITAVSNNSRLELRVSDQGRGIPKSKQESIFERFVQIEKEDAGFRGGSGLGLSIARSIVEQHGGKIGVDSTEGSGSTFWFWVPLAGTASSRSNQPESQA